MGLPNVEVLKALFETYVHARKNRWKLDENAPSHSLISAIPQAKLNVLIELLNRFNEAKTFEDWINVIYVCAEKERIENANKTANKFLGLAGLFVPKNPLLLMTIHAARAYIISQLMTDDRYEQTIKVLEKQKSDIEQAIADDILHSISDEVINQKKESLLNVTQRIEALKNSPDYVNSYFLDVILKRDPRTKFLKEEIKEKTFADYERNVIAGNRSYVICPKLMGNPTRANEPVRTNEQHHSGSTAPISMYYGPSPTTFSHQNNKAYAERGHDENTQRRHNTRRK